MEKGGQEKSGKAKEGEWRKEEQESIRSWHRDKKEVKKNRSVIDKENRVEVGGGEGVPMGNKPECVILFHNGTSLLRNGKIKSLIHSLSPKRMSNTLHFLCYFRILNGSVVLYVLLMDLIQFILNFKIRVPV
jgi:hypothetical protein